LLSATAIAPPWIKGMAEALEATSIAANRKTDILVNLAPAHSLFVIYAVPENPTPTRFRGLQPSPALHSSVLEYHFDTTFPIRPEPQNDSHAIGVVQLPLLSHD
jgi:hypothetical protein